VLGRMTGPLCDFLTGSSRGSDMLIELDRANLFLVPLDESQHWYRYHHLFGDLLRHQLQVAGGTDEVNRLHRVASAWFEKNSMPGDAIHHALASMDWHRAIALIDVQYEITVKRGEWNTLLIWFQGLPNELLRSDLRLYSHYANVLITLGSLQTAEAVLGYLESVPKVDENLRGELAFFRMSMAYRQGDLKRSWEQGKIAVKQLTEENGTMLVRALHVMAVLDVAAGRLDTAQSREVDAIRIAQRVGESWIGGTAAANLGFILWLRGKLRQALTSAEQTIELAGQSPGAAHPHGLLGVVLYERNELQEAARNSRLSVKWSEFSGYGELLIQAYYCLAQSLLAMGEAAEAESEMTKGDEASRHPTVSPLFKEWHVANRVMFAVQRGDFTAAEIWRRQLAECPADIMWILAAYAPARLLIAMGEKKAAAEQLNDLYERAITSDAWGCAISIRVYQALAATTQDEALTFLCEALKQGKPEGFIRTFVDEGRLLKPMLRKALAQGVTPQYTAKLLGIIEAEESFRSAAGGKEAAVSKSSEFLSQRELEVLRLVAEGLSNQQIADRLTVSLNTAKTHVHRLFEKLNTKDRLQSVSRAKEMKLI
jgi:LuxR family transcriptional regulator, maltose regulon positive regulatory protein